MRKKTVNKRKSFLSVLVVMAMLMATILTACGSSKAAAPSTEAETTKVETAKEEVAEPATPPETEEVVEEVAEPEPEPTPSPTPEDTKYAGIDMESTLPGKEWLDTFDGIITEPKLVVFNDETNKKVIVEEGDRVEFSKTDTLAVYIPKGKEATLRAYSMSIFEKVENIGRNIIQTEVKKVWCEGERVDCTTKLEYDGKEIELVVELKFMD